MESPAKGAAPVTWDLMPREDCVRIDGAPIEQAMASGWRERVAWVSPDVHVFAQTEDNVRHSMRMLEDVADVTATVGLDLADEASPRGFGPRQAQLLRIARAMLRESDPLALLDEPLSDIRQADRLAMFDVLRPALPDDSTLLYVTLPTLRGASQRCVDRSGARRRSSWRLVERTIHPDVLWTTRPPVRSAQIIATDAVNARMSPRKPVAVVVSQATIRAWRGLLREGVAYTAIGLTFMTGLRVTGMVPGWRQSPPGRWEPWTGRPPPAC